MAYFVAASRSAGESVLAQIEDDPRPGASAWIDSTSERDLPAPVRHVLVVDVPRCQTLRCDDRQVRMRQPERRVLQVEVLQEGGALERVDDDDRFAFPSVLVGVPAVRPHELCRCVTTHWRRARTRSGNDGSPARPASRKTGWAPIAGIIRSATPAWDRAMHGLGARSPCPGRHSQSGENRRRE